jgi:tetratricopeptide (TPR) repeat protein
VFAPTSSRPSWSSTHPASGGLLLTTALLLRRLDRLEEAEPFAARADSLEPTWGSAVQLANIRRALGDVPGAREAYAHAVERRPNELSPLLDLADMLLDHGDPAGAVEAYGRVLRLAPGHRLAGDALRAARALLERPPAE